MGKKNKGFNTPFSGLKKVALKPIIETKPSPDAKIHDGTSLNRAPQRTDAELFHDAMHGVSGHKPSSNRVEPSKRKKAKAPSADESVLHELQELVSGKGSFHLNVEDTGEFQSGRIASVNNAQMQKLRRGDIPFRRHVDLHGMTSEQAHDELKAFIKNARHDDQRCVLVVTGRGIGSPGGRGVLRDALPRWLGRSPIAAHVLAFATAQRTDGGPGAFYVLLRRAGLRPHL